VAAKPLGAASAVFVNDGAGVFSLLAEIGPADADDRSVATGDVDGDGYADVVIAGAAGNRLYLNQGGASFLPAEIPESAPGAADVALIDVAGSTLPDLVLAYTAASTVFHENLGGTFGPAVTIDAASAGRIASGDFNGDGFADLVLGRLAPGPNGRPSNPVYLNNGSGGFVAVSVLGASPTADVIAADVDVDGAIDIVSVNTTGAHQVYAGDGDGNFTLNPALIASPGALRGAVAPIGRLQLPDLVLAGRDGISVFFNDGEGNFGLGDTEPPVIALIGPDEVALDVESGYTDAGATATDNIDGTVTPAIDNPVNTGVIGTYTVTFTAMDSAGNAAAPVTRSVTVNPQPSLGGGGGTTGWLFVALLGGASILSRMRRRT
jgi:hypothetical protein